MNRENEDLLYILRDLLSDKCILLRFSIKKDENNKIVHMLADYTHDLIESEISDKVYNLADTIYRVETILHSTYDISELQNYTVIYDRKEHIQRQNKVLEIFRKLSETYENQIIRLEALTLCIHNIEAIKLYIDLIDDMNEDLKLNIIKEIVKHNINCRVFFDKEEQKVDMKYIIKRRLELV